jgi:hypothetical protein
MRFLGCAHFVGATAPLSQCVFWQYALICAINHLLNYDYNSCSLQG